MNPRFLVPISVVVSLLCCLEVRAVVYTGQQLFQGVFFGVGPVAQLVPELYSQSPPTNTSIPDISLLVSNLTLQASILNSNGAPEDATRLLRLASRISSVPTNTAPAVLTSQIQSNLMSQIDLQDPTFFARFATNVQSGNAVLVSAAVREGAERLWQQINTMPDSIFASDVWFANNRFVLNVADVVAYLEIAGAYAAVIVLVALWVAPSPGAGQYLFEDKISLLTARLNANGPMPIPTVSEWGMIFLIVAILAFGIYVIVKRQDKMDRRT